MPFCRSSTVFAAVLIGTAVGLMPRPATAAPGPKPFPATPEGVTITRGVTYLAPDRKETLDLYLPASRAAGARSPGIVIIHGGGWSGGSNEGGREFEEGTTLAKAGYVCASVAYRVSKHDRWPTNVYDCKNAVRFLRKNAAVYGVDTDHIGVIGGSAGGHLALMVGYTSDVPALEPPSPYPGISDKVQAVVDMYGISDVRTRKNIAPDGTPGVIGPQSKSVFGDKPDVTDADFARASPTAHISATTPPTLILHGTADTTVDRDQSITLDKLLTGQKVEHQLILIPGIGHTFDLERWNGKPLPFDLRPIVLRFFDSHLKTQTAKG